MIESVSQEIKKKYFVKKNYILEQTPAKQRAMSNMTHRPVFNQCVIDYKMNPRAPGIKFMKGNGDITNHFALKEQGNTTLYQNSYQGKQVQERTKSCSEYFKVSSAVACMPDPCQMTGVTLKLKTLSESLNETNEKMRKTISYFKNLAENGAIRSPQRHYANSSIYSPHNRVGLNKTSRV